jgi:hypothetical protein
LTWINFAVVSVRKSRLPTDRGESRLEKSNMGEMLHVNKLSRRHALSLFGLAAALVPAVAFGVSSAGAQTPGMERREERREERQDRREDRRDNRQERRDDRRDSRGLNDDQSQTNTQPAPK